MKIAINLLSSAVPASIGSLINYIIPCINLAFIGHHNDPAKLSGMGMGNLLISLISLGPFWGLNGALETLVSQA